MKQWIYYLSRFIKGVFFLLVGVLSLAFGVIVIRLNFSYHEATAMIYAIDHDPFRRCPISAVVYKAADGRKITSPISSEESCDDIHNPRIGDSVEIVYHPWLPFPMASLKSDMGKNSDSLDPGGTLFGVAAAAIFSVFFLIKSWETLCSLPPIR